MTSVWSDCLSDLHIHHQKEPRHRYADTENRPDIVFYDIATGSTKELDIAFAHRWSKDTIKGAAKEDGYATAKRSKENNQIQQLIITRRLKTTCI